MHHEASNSDLSGGMLFIVYIIHVNYVTTELCFEYSMLCDSGCFISADITETDAPGHGSKLTA